jgi:hypothetical protein
MFSPFSPFIYLKFRLKILYIFGQKKKGEELKVHSPNFLLFFTIYIL